MYRGHGATFPMLLLLAAVLLFCSTWLPQVSGVCHADHCGMAYRESVDVEGIPEPESTVPFCLILREYGSCLSKSSRECRGDFVYHTSVVSVKKMLADNNCTALIGPEKTPPVVQLPRPSVIPKLPSNAIPPPPPAPRPCTFHGRPRFRYCGLFGDPHLKTFDNKYQTCRVQGAWPLIDNPYLAVQVTNERVLDNSNATAITKVTVIIKGRGMLCTQEKMYVATADQPLPGWFEDGTDTSGPGQSVVLTLSEVDPEHRMAEIYLRYIETTLVVRQVGKYLAFAARLPEELAAMDGDELQLCTTGCPSSERLDLAAEHGMALPWEEALRRCQDTDGLSNDINNQLTDHYLDWCVFDVMTTGDESSHFAAAAHSAQADVLRFDLGSLKNRTTTKLRPRDVNSPFGTGSAVSQCSVQRILTFTASLLTCVRWWLL